MPIYQSHVNYCLLIQVPNSCCQHYLVIISIVCIRISKKLSKDKWQIFNYLLVIEKMWYYNYFLEIDEIFSDIMIWIINHPLRKGIYIYTCTDTNNDLKPLKLPCFFITVFDILSLYKLVKLRLATSWCVTNARFCNRFHDIIDTKFSDSL